MSYSDKEDIEYIKNLLNGCIQFKYNNNIYYITSDNITRQLKYNKLYKNNKEIVIDLTKISFDKNIILRQELSKNILYDNLYVNYELIWKYFENKYNFNFHDNQNLLEQLFYKILNLSNLMILSELAFNELYSLGNKLGVFILKIKQ